MIFSTGGVAKKKEEWLRFWINLCSCITSFFFLFCVWNFKQVTLDSVLNQLVVKCFPIVLCICCANSTLKLKLITINKQKLNNKHTQRTQKFTWFNRLPTSTTTTEKFHYKIGRYNSDKNTLKKPKSQLHPNTLSQKKQ